MVVHKVIIHELSKPLGTSGAKLSKSKTLMDTSHDDVIKLVEDLNRRYRKKDEKQGVFDKNNPTKFHESFGNFYHDENDEQFIDFSHASAENLRDRIEGIGAAKGGYLVYAVYEDYRKYCSVFFVRDTTSIAFKRNKTVGSFDLDKVQHIDFEKLAMACRINMELFIEDNKKYLSFIHNKSDNLSQYFVNWISSSDTVTSEEETKLLLKALKTMPMPENPITKEPYKREDVIKSAYDQINASPTKSANLFDIGRIAIEDEDYIANFMYQNYPTVPNEFKAHSSTLRRFIRVYAKADNIELNFHPSAFNNGTIKFDENNTDQIIINSRDLRNQVEESLQNE